MPSIAGLPVDHTLHTAIFSPRYPCRASFYQGALSSSLSLAGPIKEKPSPRVIDHLIMCDVSHILDQTIPGIKDVFMW